MKLASNQADGLVVQLDSSLKGLLARLEDLSLQPSFAFQRELALSRVLRPYFERGTRGLLTPLPQEVELANLYVYCDFYPEDGQLSLIEQLRDVITEHIPEEQRRWLDPLKHSYTDLLEVEAAEGRAADLSLRSMGDQSRFGVKRESLIKEVRPGDVIFARLIREPGETESGRAVFAGPGIVLAAGDARALFEATLQWRKEMEIASGSFTLGEWQEFAKQHGYMLSWSFAHMRFAALADAVGHIQYRGADHQPFLYAVALYDHHEYRFLNESLSTFEGLAGETRQEPKGGGKAEGLSCPIRSWIEREGGATAGAVVARLTLTPSQLVVECDSSERLNTIKHHLASTFGFSLHFRGESLAPPARALSLADLTSGQPLTLEITPEEDHGLLKSFLETAYLEWADHPLPVLGGDTPRRRATSAHTRVQVQELIDQMERQDIGLRRTGRSAFDYNRLREQVGLS